MVPKEQIQEHIVEELIDVQVTPRVVDVPFLQIQNQPVEVVNNVMRERVSEHILEQNCRKPRTKL